MGSVYVSTVIAAPIDRVWQIVRDFNGLSGWMPGIEASEIEDGRAATSVGAVRRMALGRGGGQARERLEALSDSDHAIAYSLIAGPLPIDRLVATIRLRPVTDADATFGEWTADFDAAAGKEAEAQALLAKVFGAGWRGLKKRLDV
jgi:uncharacterized protein YndB with AHSA1/START domain